MFYALLMAVEYLNLTALKTSRITALKPPQNKE